MSFFGKSPVRSGLLPSRPVDIEKKNAIFVSKSMEIQSTYFINLSSLAECGAFCSAWKNTPEVCTLLDSTEIFPAQDGPTEVVNIDASRQPGINY